jgi:hypothetical protein
VVILQGWGLLTLVKRATRRGGVPRVLVLRPEVIVAGAYMPCHKRWEKGGNGRGV